MNASPRPHFLGTTPDLNQPVHAYELNGSGGLAARVLDYGGLVTHLRVPDRHGVLADVVLGFDDLASYLAPHPYFGALAGRVAGRITGAQFTLEGRPYPLLANDGANHLHGGQRGFDKQVWSAEAVARPDGAPSLRLSLTSPDGDEGYPGKVKVAVTYTVTADNTFLIESHATTDAATPFNLTHHSYFNLGGHASGSLADHSLAVAAADYAPTDDDMTLLGQRAPVSPSNDLRFPRRLGDVITGFHQQHGDLYFLADSAPGRLTRAAVLRDPSSGRILAVDTTEPCLQLYTGASLDGSLVGKSGHRYDRYAGLCLECEDYPDAVHTPGLAASPLLLPERPHHAVTAYRFTAE